jgi:hypothetical protein
MKIIINISVCKTRSHCNTNIPSLIRHHPEDGFLKNRNMLLIIISNYNYLKLCLDTVYCLFYLLVYSDFQVCKAIDICLFNQEIQTHVNVFCKYVSVTEVGVNKTS